MEKMKKIKSFTIDHMTLLPGVYVSREDAVSPCDAFRALNEPSVPHSEFSAGEIYPVTTYDIRITRPNFEPVMSTAETHAIEHLGATYLRNRVDMRGKMIYWGPMGCRTGFYMIVAGFLTVETVVELMKDLFSFIADYEGAIPGATPGECGNYTDMDLCAAHSRAAAYLKVLEAL